MTILKASWWSYSYVSVIWNLTMLLRRSVYKREVNWPLQISITCFLTSSWVFTVSRTRCMA